MFTAKIQTELFGITGLWTCVFLEPPLIQAVVPAEVLSLVGALLPGHQDLMLSPVMLKQMIPTSGADHDLGLFLFVL